MHHIAFPSPFPFPFIFAFGIAACSVNPEAHATVRPRGIVRAAERLPQHGPGTGADRSVPVGARAHMLPLVRNVFICVEPRQLIAPY